MINQLTDYQQAKAQKNQARATLFHEIFGDFEKYQLFLNDQNFAWDEHSDQCISSFPGFC